MTLVFFLKLLSEFSFYFLFGSYLLHLTVDAGLATVLPVLALAAVGGACYFTGRRWRRPLARWAPLVLLFPLGLLTVRGPYQAALFALAAGYLAYLTAANKLTVSYEEARRDFVLQLKILAPAVPVGMISTLFAPADPLALPLLLFIPLSSILMLRMLRHDPEVLARPRFILTNALVVLAAAGVGLALASPASTRLLSQGANLLYKLFLMPPLLLFGYLWTMVLKGLAMIGHLLGIEPLKPLDEGLPPPEDGYRSDAVITEDPFVDVSPELILQLLLGVVVTLFLAGLIWYLVRMARRRQDKFLPPEVRQQRTRTEGRAKEALQDGLPPREPRAAVRYYYRKFLRLCGHMGKHFRPSADSQMIESAMREALPDQPLRELRAVYIRARYSPGPVSREQAQRAKDLFNALKEEEKRARDGK